MLKTFKVFSLFKQFKLRFSNILCFLKQRLSRFFTLHVLNIHHRFNDFNRNPKHDFNLYEIKIK